MGGRSSQSTEPLRRAIEPSVLVAMYTMIFRMIFMLGARTASSAQRAEHALFFRVSSRFALSADEILFPGTSAHGNH
jgi:hypothetical protein